MWFVLVGVFMFIAIVAVIESGKVRVGVCLFMTGIAGTFVAVSLLITLMQ